MGKNSQVKLTFGSKKAALHFMKWLCGSGEQDYFYWMECREQEESGNITATNFEYDFKQFNINTKCSRIDKK